MIIVYVLAGILALILTVICLILVWFALLFVSGLFVDPAKEYTKDNGYFRFLLTFSSLVMMPLLSIRVHVSGMEKLPDPKEGRVLFVSNHRSKFDPILTWAVFRKYKLAFISKPSNFNVPFFGRIIRKCCFMAIDREDPRKALPTIYQAADLIKRGETSVGVYPEGTRNYGKELLPFHDGVFQIARKAGSRIVVLALTGTDEIAHRTPFRKTDVYMDILEVMDEDEVRHTKASEISKRVREETEKALNARRMN